VSSHLYLIPRRCSQRRFLLRPDAATNNAFLYCLIHAALRSQIDVLLLCAMGKTRTTLIPG
jgi:REP-associated tyrosine transposase